MDSSIPGLECKIADLGNACWVSHHYTEDIQTRQDISQLYSHWLLIIRASIIIDGSHLSLCHKESQETPPKGYFVPKPQMALGAQDGSLWHKLDGVSTLFQH